MPSIGPKHLAALFTAHAPALVLYARGFVPAALAEDVVQEAFVRLAGMMRPPENPRGWLFATTRNAALDALKHHRRASRRERLAGHVNGAREAPAPSSSLEAAEVEATLITLPAVEREIVTLRIWAEATFSDIAQLTGLPLSSVHARYTAALDHLRLHWNTPCPQAPIP